MNVIAINGSPNSDDPRRIRHHHLSEDYTILIVFDEAVLDDVIHIL